MMRVLPILAIGYGASGQSLPEPVSSDTPMGSGTGKAIVAPKTKKHNTEGGITKVCDVISA